MIVSTSVQSTDAVARDRPTWYASGMAGIVFVRTRDLSRIVAFYRNQIGMSVWLEQPAIRILRHDNMLIGFQESEGCDTDTLLTFFSRDRREVDAIYDSLSRHIDERCSDSPIRIDTEPAVNERYRIYNFFARDPDGRRIEFQTFLHPIDPVPGVNWME